jgi:ribosomal protein S18 acetylase RimI-like enzyme
VSPTTSPISRSRLLRGGLPRSASLSSGGNRLRVTPWQGQPLVALVGPGRTARNLAPGEIVTCLRELADRQIRAAVTPALSPHEAEPFFRAGFRLHEHLHLLARPISGPPPPVTSRLRRGWTWDRARVLEVDNKAFEQFWRFDSFSLKEARRATPASRFRVAISSDGVIGYAVTGRAGGRGYLQRLAVDPTAQGNGIGASLVNDCLTWLYRKGVSLALVNTQERNSRALALYERLGFVRQREGLLVLRWDRPA